MESIFKWKINFARDARRIAHSRGETSGKSRMIDRGNKSEKIEAEEAPAPSPSVGTGRNKNVGGGRRDCTSRYGKIRYCQPWAEFSSVPSFSKTADITVH